MQRIEPTTILTAIFAGALVGFVCVAQSKAADFGSSSSFNAGYNMTAGEENRAAVGGTRDANNNRVITNGLLGGGSVQDGVQQGAISGSGNHGSGSATAIGNSLNVTVTGSWNTVIVDSKQINNGNQTATTSLNGELKL